MQLHWNARLRQPLSVTSITISPMLLYLITEIFQYQTKKSLNDYHSQSNDCFNYFVRDKYQRYGVRSSLIVTNIGGTGHLRR